MHNSVTNLKLLRSSLVSRYRQLRDEPWKARAPESEERVQALAVGITTLGADRVGPTSHRPIARAWKGSSLGSGNRSCLHTYELLDNRVLFCAADPVAGRADPRF